MSPPGFFSLALAGGTLLWALSASAADPEEGGPSASPDAAPSEKDEGAASPEADSEKDEASTSRDAAESDEGAASPEAAHSGTNESAASPEALEELSMVKLLSTEVTTGTFLDFDLIRSPMSITVIERKDIIVSGARNLGELLEIYVPGFQLMINKWNGDIWGLRGTAPDRNTKIIFLINGLKLNTESRDGVFTETTLGLMDDIERVEVMRGPAGTSYGSGAIAGVVNVITRTPKETSGDFRLSYGTWNTVSAEGFSDIHFDKDQSVALSAGYWRSRGTDDGETRIYGNGSFPTDYPADSVGTRSAPSPNGEPADGGAWRSPGNFRGSIDYHWGNFRLYLRGTRREQVDGGYYAFDPFPQYGTDIPDGATGVVDGDVIDNTDPRSRTESFGHNRRIYVVDAAHVAADYSIPVDQDTLFFQGAVMGVSNRTVWESREKYLLRGETQRGIRESFGERRYFFETLYTLRRVPNLRSANGFQGRIDDFGNDFDGLNMDDGVARHKAISEVTYINLALFSENEYAVGDFRFDAAARLDYHTRTNFVVSPKAAIIYTTSENQALKLMYRTAANYGSVDDYEHNRNHFDDEGNVTTSPRLETPTSPDSPRVPATDLDMLHQLKPEKIRSYELASSNRVFDLFFNTSISYNQVRDLFTWSQQLFRAVNVGAYDFVNFEVDARYKESIWDLGGSWAYQRLINTDPNAGTDVEVPATEVVPNGDGTYRLVLVPGAAPETREINPVRDSITVDGTHFLSLATTTTKFFASAQVLDWLLLHANARIHWGLQGRKLYYQEDERLGDNNLEAESKPIVKLNASVHAALPYEFTLSLYGNNLLGTTTNRHSIRWQQMADPTQRDLYTADIRAFYAAVRKDF